MTVRLGRQEGDEDGLHLHVQFGQHDLIAAQLLA